MVAKIEQAPIKRVGIDYPLLKESKMQWSMEQADMIKLSQLLVHSKLCINSGSTLCIDALSCNIPVLVSAFDSDSELNYWKSARRLMDFPHLRKLREMGGFVVASSIENLIDEITNFISDPNRDLEKRKHALVMEISSNSGMATTSVFDYLINLN